MDLHSRIANRWYQEKFALLRVSMSLQEAYKTIGVSPGATPDEIKAAYRLKSKTIHPDQGGTTEQMVALNVAKEILDGKRRPDGGGGGYSSPSRPYSDHYEDTRKEREEAAKKERERQEKLSVTFDQAKSDAPSGVDWKFRSTEMYVGQSSAYVKAKVPSYITSWVLYGQTADKHVFMLVENAQAAYERSDGYKEWSMGPVKAFPLSMDLTKLAPKVIKELPGLGKLADGKPKAVTKFVNISGLSQPEFRNTRAGVALKDILIGLNLVSTDKLPARKTVIELEGRLNKERYNNRMRGGMNIDTWKYHDFTLFVNGKGYPLAESTMENLSKLGSGSLFWMAVYSPVQYDFSRRRVLTRLKGRGYVHYVLDMVEKALTTEPPELTVHILKAMEESETPEKTASRLFMGTLSAVDQFTTAKVFKRYIEEVLSWKRRHPPRPRSSRDSRSLSSRR